MNFSMDYDDDGEEWPLSNVAPPSPETAAPPLEVGIGGAVAPPATAAPPSVAGVGGADTSAAVAAKRKPEEQKGDDGDGFQAEAPAEKKVKKEKKEKKHKKGPNETKLGEGASSSSTSGMSVQDNAAAEDLDDTDASDEAFESGRPAAKKPRGGKQPAKKSPRPAAKKAQGGEQPAKMGLSSPSSSSSSSKSKKGGKAKAAKEGAKNGDSSSSSPNDVRGDETFSTDYHLQSKVAATLGGWVKTNRQPCVVASPDPPLTHPPRRTCSAMSRTPQLLGPKIRQLTRFDPSLTHNTMNTVFVADSTF